MQRLGIQGMNDPRLQTVVRVENGLDDMDVDITIEEGPDTPNLQYEQWQAFTQLPAPVLTQMPLELFISMNPGLKDKDKFLDILRQHQAQQAQGQQAQQAIAQSTAEANLAKTQADAADKIAQSKDRTAQALERMHGMAMGPCRCSDDACGAGRGRRHARPEPVCSRRLRNRPPLSEPRKDTMP